MNSIAEFYRETSTGRALIHIGIFLMAFGFLSSPGDAFVISILLILAGFIAISGGIASLVCAAKKHRALKEHEKEWNHGK